jgi:hypothetical protein
MKITGKVTYRGWENGPAWGTHKEVNLSIEGPGSSMSFRNVSKGDLDRIIANLKQIREDLANAPDKNAWG